jgi:hypothetical protein
LIDESKEELPAMFSASSSGGYRARWFSGRRDSMTVQQIKLALAYVQALGPTSLSGNGQFRVVIPGRG